MNASGVTDRLLDLSSALVGRFRGGLAQVNVLSNLVFFRYERQRRRRAAGPGLIIARMMVRKGYSLGFSAATSAAAATIGPIVPPSIPMVFLRAHRQHVGGAMFLGGLVPAVLMAISLMTIIAVLAKQRNFPREAPIPLREWRQRSAARSCR